MAAFVTKLAMILIFIIILDTHHYALPTKSDESRRQTDLEENELVTEPLPNTTKLQSEKERKTLINRVHHLKKKLAYAARTLAELHSGITTIRKFEEGLEENRKNPEIDEEYFYTMTKQVRNAKSHLITQIRTTDEHVKALTNELHAVEHEIIHKYMEKHSNTHHKKVKGKFLPIPKEASTVIHVGHQAPETSTLAASKSTFNNHLVRDEYETVEITTISNVVTSTSNEIATQFKDVTTISNEATDNTTTITYMSTNVTVGHNTTTTNDSSSFDIFKTLLDAMRNKTTSMNSKSQQPPEKIVGKTNHQIVLVKFPANESDGYQQPNHMVLTKNEEFQYDEDESEA